MGLARFIAGHLPPWRTKPEPRHLVVGREGENAAARHLRGLGFKILRRNFRARRGGEIDLVCRDPSAKALVFVEVKSRTSEDFGRPLVAVDKKKRRLLIRAAMEWLRMLDMPDITFRFDVVEVVGGDQEEVRHIENAFGLSRPFHY
jgi:putative endonuclease